MTLRVCMVEDDRGYRESVELVMSLGDRARVVAGFETVESFLAAEDATAWDVVLMDLDFPGLGGVEAIEQFRALGRSTPVVVLTAFEDPPRILAAIRAGADGYLLKRATGDELLEHLELAVSGGSPLTPGVARSVLDLLRTPKNPAPELSPREWQVLEALVAGLAYKQIAAQLTVSIDTVRTYVRSLYKKLRVHSATEAVSKALREGWVS